MKTSLNFFKNVAFPQIEEGLIDEDVIGLKDIIITNNAFIDPFFKPHGKIKVIKASFYDYLNYCQLTLEDMANVVAKREHGTSTNDIIVNKQRVERAKKFKQEFKPWYQK